MGPSGDRGLFLVLEGGEGAGKSTQARLLGEWMARGRIPHVVSREPGGTPVGEGIRRLLLDRRELTMPAETELLLMLAARAAFVRDVVEPVLARGHVMVADRFEYSTFVYQGLARGLGVERVRELNRFATGGLAPDLTIVFDVEAEVAQERRRREGKADDRIENEGDAFFRRVRDGYRDLARSDPGCELLPASSDPETVHEAVVRLLADRFPEPFAAAAG